MNERTNEWDLGEGRGVGSSVDLSAVALVRARTAFKRTLPAPLRGAASFESHPLNPRCSQLCDYHTLPDGRDTKPITWCNIEGYNGMHPRFLPITKQMLAKMPDGRCPYPPGDRPGDGTSGSGLLGRIGW